MPVLDFSEIPPANESNGKQDTFELFARDFLEFLGFEIVQEPDRGPDGGKDLIVKEERSGVGGKSEVLWLVSCKHKSHSGRSVNVNDEADIPGRVAMHNCQGFMGFYSTIPSFGLKNKINGIKNRFECVVYDHEKIEKYLLHSLEGVPLLKRYFPSSLKKWRKQNPKPEKYFWNFPELKCESCGRNLLEPDEEGIIVFWEKASSSRKDKSRREIVDVYTSCKGNCDGILKAHYKSKYPDCSDGWEDIIDVCIPTVYAKWIVTIFNELNGTVIYTDIAFKKTSDFMLSIFPYISRELSDEEKEKVRSLSEIPPPFGIL